MRGRALGVERRAVVMSWLREAEMGFVGVDLVMGMRLVFAVDDIVIGDWRI